MTRKKRPSKARDGAGDDRSVSVDPIIGNSVGPRLTAYYGDLYDRPVPQRFIDLIDDLEQRGSEPRSAAPKYNHKASGNEDGDSET